MDSAPPSPRPRRLDVSTDLAALERRIDGLLADGRTLQPETRSTYDRYWQRYRRWCETTPEVPDDAALRGDQESVSNWIEAEFRGLAGPTVRAALLGVSWGRQRVGLPPISLARGTWAHELVTRAGRARTTPRRGARPADAMVWAEALSIPAPPADVATLRHQAALALAFAAGCGLGARSPVKSVCSHDVIRMGRGVAVRLAGAELPVSAGANAIMTLARTEDPGASLLGPAAQKLARASHRAACKTMRALGFGAPGRVGDRLDQQVDADGLARLLALGDLAASRWLADQVALVLQVLGGYRPSDLARLKVWDVRFAEHTPPERPSREAVVITLPRSKGDPAGRGHVRTLPSWDAYPTLCPVRLLRTWMWLLNLQPHDPLLPPGTPKSIYRTQHVHTPLDAARKRWERPIKRRLGELQLDTRGMAGTTGRHTIASAAAAAGVNRFAIAEHLGHRRLESTAHYVEAASQADAAHRMARLVSSDIPELDR